MQHTEQQLRGGSGRNYGVDLLRIVSMMMIVFTHAAGLGGFVNLSEPLSLSYEVTWALYIAFRTGTNCFALITGYVFVGRKVKDSGAVYLITQVTLYSLGIVALFWVLSPASVGRQDLLKALLAIPQSKYWFCTSYVCMAVFIPYFNRLIDAMDRRTFTRFLLVLFLVFSLFPTLFHYDIAVTKSGYSPLWLACMYFLGAYLKRYVVTERHKPGTYLLGALASIGFVIVFRIVATSLPTHLGMRAVWDNYLLERTCPFMVLYAVFLLLFFSSLKLKPVMISLVKYFAPAAFGVYIIHMNDLVWNRVLYPFFTRQFLPSSLPFLLGELILKTLLVWLVCSLLDRIRLRVFDLLRLKKLCSRLESALHGVMDGLLDRLCPAQELV